MKTLIHNQSRTVLQGLCKEEKGWGYVNLIIIPEDGHHERQGNFLGTDNSDLKMRSGACSLIHSICVATHLKPVATLGSEQSKN